jgi:hypothetical protein
VVDEGCTTTNESLRLVGGRLRWWRGGGRRRGALVVDEGCTTTNESLRLVGGRLRWWRGGAGGETTENTPTSLRDSLVVVNAG